jgi:hypothetical protein
MKPKLLLAAVMGLWLLAGCAPTSSGVNGAKTYPTFGEIKRMAPELDSIIAPGTSVEVIAKGFDWSEGPVWVESGKYLLFSDIPPN